jgi:hypothetical protein
MNRDIRVVVDPRGETDTFEPFMLAAFDGCGRQVWYEGIRKDRSAMYPEYAAIVDAFISGGGAS